MKINKIYAVRAQLERAIDLYFTTNDIVCVLALAWAAQEILSVLWKKKR